MPATYDIQFGGEQLVLGADRTLWWPRQRILFATDLHAGKAEHMRLHGLPIPGGNLESDLASLTQVAHRLGAGRLIFLGDLFHSEHNAEWDVFVAWCQAQLYDIELVRGNHDRFLTDEQFKAAGLRVHSEPYTLDSFELRHHPADTIGNDRFVLAGHLHPVAWAAGVAKDRLRLRCFVVDKQQLIVPAFGSLTGGLVVDRRPARQLYACAPDGTAIIQLS